MLGRKFPYPRQKSSTKFYEFGSFLFLLTLAVGLPVAILNAQELFQGVSYVNRSNPYRSQNRNSFDSRRGASRPQSERHSLRDEENVSRANPYETNRFGSSSRRGQSFDSKYRRSREKDLSHDRDGRTSYYQGDDDPAEGRRSSEPSRGDQGYRSERRERSHHAREDRNDSRREHFNSQRDEHDNRYSQWNRPSDTSNGRHFDRTRQSFDHYDDPRNSGSRYSPMEDDRWQDDLDLDHAYEYRVEDHEDNERVNRRSSMNRYDRPAQNRSRYSNDDQNYASHNRSRNRRF